MKREEAVGASDRGTVDQGSLIRSSPSSRVSTWNPLHPGLLALLGGFIAGIVSFAVGEWFHGWFAPEGVPQMLSGAQVMLPTYESTAVANSTKWRRGLRHPGGLPGPLPRPRRGPGSEIRESRFGRRFDRAGPGAALGACLPLLTVVRTSSFRSYGTPMTSWSP